MHFLSNSKALFCTRLNFLTNNISFFDAKESNKKFPTLRTSNNSSMNAVIAFEARVVGLYCEAESIYSY